MKSILVPTDFSPVSLNALHYAAAFCAEQDYKLYILNVMHVPAIDANAGIELSETLMQNERSKTEKKMKLIQDELAQQSSIQTETRCLFGLGSDVIVEQAQELDIDYIFMGTSGESGMLSTLLGSVTLSVSRKSKVPVLAIPENAQFKGFNYIVFGNDHKEKLESNIDAISNLNKGLDTKVAIVSVEPGSEEYSEEVIFDKANFKEVSIWSKSVSSGIQEYLETEEADMLVLKHHERNFIQELFQKSTTKELLMECTVPLLILN